MDFYANDIPSKGRKFVRLMFTDEEAEKLGGRGTRLSVRLMQSGAYFLAPDPTARARLHRKQSDKRNRQPNPDGPWEVTITTPEIQEWPSTFMTPLAYDYAEGGFILKPNDSPLKPVKPNNRHSGPRTPKFQQLPLDMPPKPDSTSVERAIERNARPPVPLAKTYSPLNVDLLKDIMAAINSRTTVQDLVGDLDLLKEALQDLPSIVELKPDFHIKVMARVEIEL